MGEVTRSDAGSSRPFESMNRTVGMPRMPYFSQAAVTSGVMRSSGTVMVPTLLSISAILLVEVPAAWLLSRHFGINGVWMAYPITFIAMLLLQTSFYRLYWRRQPIVRLV